LNPNTFNQLKNADWGTIGKRLLAFAIWWARKYDCSVVETLEVAHGMTLEDVVQHVIVKTLSGERQWDPEKGPLEPWLKDQIRSVIDAQYNSAPHRHETQLADEIEQDSRPVDSVPQQEASVVATEPSTPEDQILEEEEAQLVSRQVGLLFQAVEGEPELEQVLDAAMKVSDPRPRFIAAELGVPVDDIYNRVRRLRRRFYALEQEMTDGESEAAGN
jgi:DNA-directed RNA polymerase specialized sigma24 family protein